MRLASLLLVLGLVLAPLALAGPLAVFWAALFAGGLALNPSLTTSSLLVDEYAPAAQGEAFGWVSTAIGIGGALGSAAAGVAGERFGPSAPFPAAAVFALLAAALAATLINRGPR
ncbi:hypothetical protein GCM10020001_037130 [Nonomuraea salmonea]